MKEVQAEEDETVVVGHLDKPEVQLCDHPDLLITNPVSIQSCEQCFRSRDKRVSVHILICTCCLVYCLFCLTPDKSLHQK